MTEINLDDVERLAKLSGLRLTSDEKKYLTKDMQNILNYVDELASLDTSGIEPTYQVSGLENVFRDDVVVENVVDREDLLKLAPSQEKHQVKVPEVL